MKKGLFVVFEGVDGSGKTSVSQQVTAELQAHGVDAIWTCEPSNDHAAGEFIRSVLRQEAKIEAWGLAMAFAVNRLDHLNRMILPAINAGKVVVCDRYLMSSIVYQGLDGIHSQVVEDLNRYAFPADVTLFLDAEPRVCAARIKTRMNGAGVELYEHRIKQARDRYYSLIRMPRFGAQLIDASQPIEGVVSDSVQVIRSHLDGV